MSMMERRLARTKVGKPPKRRHRRQLSREERMARVRARRKLKGARLDTPLPREGSQNAE